jgi:predicted AAA+ superfamily ATPase
MEGPSAAPAGVVVPSSVVPILRAANPWWEGKPGRLVPPYKRWPFTFLRRRLEEPLAPALVLRGPRQVGKTTLQEQLIDDLLTSGRAQPNEVFRVQFDDLPTLRSVPDPILTLSRWYESAILGRTFNEATRSGKPAYLFLDEVQNLADWGAQVKALVDVSNVRVVVTGSSALRLQLGKDSLAGRLTSLEMGPLYLREIAGLRGIGDVQPFLPFDGPGPLGDRTFWEALRKFGEGNREFRDQAFALFDRWGAYPLAHDHPSARWDEISQQLRESIIERAIQHDLRLGDRGRKRDERLLGEVFRLACRNAGQSPNPVSLASEIRETLPGDVGPARVRHYLEFLDSTLLLRLVPPLEIRLKRRKGFHKICICDPALRAAYLQEVVPLSAQALDAAPHLRDLAGHIAESVVGYFLSGIPGLELAWAPSSANEPEVDFVITVGSRRIPMEVKYSDGVDGNRDTSGLRAFLAKRVYNAPFGVLVTKRDQVPERLPENIVAVPLPSLLLMR